MALSAVSSTSYRRTIGPATEGQTRRDGQSGRLFSLQAREVANDEIAMAETTPIVRAETQPPSEAALEKWLRLMGAARQIAYEDEQQAALPADSANMRYRLQRTYFDQERQATPPMANQADRRMQAYYAAGRGDSSARVIDFVV